MNCPVRGGCLYPDRCGEDYCLVEHAQMSHLSSRMEQRFVTVPAEPICLRCGRAVDGHGPAHFDPDAIYDGLPDPTWDHDEVAHGYFTEGDE